MRIYRFIFLALLIIPNIGFSQTMYEVKDYRFHEIADSLIDLKTDSEFKRAIRYQRTWECYYDTSDINSKGWSSYKSIKGVNVYYDFINSCDQTYYYQTKGFRRGGFEITFDLNHKIVKQPDFKFLKNVTTIHKMCFISYDTAEIIAIKNLKPKSRKTWTSELVYDLVTNETYWLIERESGFRNGIIETIKIDALNKKILEKTSIPYRKGFFNALSDKIFRVP